MQISTLLRASLYTGVVSITITLFNKAVFSWYNFNYPNALTAAQMMFALVFLAILKVRHNAFAPVVIPERAAVWKCSLILTVAVHRSGELSRL